MNRKKCRAAAKSQKAGDKKKTYGLSLETKPLELSPWELAVLIGVTMSLSKYSNLPGFDPTSVRLEISFPSGHVGAAKLVEDRSS